eukprot:g10043.t1
MVIDGDEDVALKCAADILESVCGHEADIILPATAHHGVYPNLLTTAPAPADYTAKKSTAGGGSTARRANGSGRGTGTKKLKDISSRKTPGMNVEPREVAEGKTTSTKTKLDKLLEGLGDPEELGVGGIRSPADSPLDIPSKPTLPKPPDGPPQFARLGWEELAMLVEEEISRFNTRFVKTAARDLEAESLLGKIFRNEDVPQLSVSEQLSPQPKPKQAKMLQ